MTQLEMLIQIFEKLGRTVHYSRIYEEYEKLTETPLTPGVKAGIRKLIEDNSSDSANFKGKNDIFYSVCGKGVWGLR